MKKLFKLHKKNYLWIITLKSINKSKCIVISLFTIVIFTFFFPNNTEAQNLWDWSVYNYSIHTPFDVGIGTNTPFTPDA